MKIKRSRLGGYEVLTLTQDITFDSDLASLVTMVKELVRRKVRKIAVHFSEHSCLSTRSISPLVQCHAILNDHGGELAVIGPNEDILHTMREVELDLIVRVFATESELAGWDSPGEETSAGSG